MNIEVRNITQHIGLSQETPAYTATVYVDGQKFAQVSNEGHGGPDFVQPISGTYSEFLPVLKALGEQIAAEYPAEEFRGMTICETLESLCHKAVYDQQEKRRLKGQLARKVLIAQEQGGKMLVYTLKGKKSPALLEVARKLYPKVLNDLPLEEAFELLVAGS